MKRLPGLKGARPTARLRVVGLTVAALSPAVLTVSCLPAKVDSSCPDVFIVQDLGTITRYGANGSHEPANQQFTAEMRDIKGDCSVKPGDSDVRMSFSIIGERGGNDHSGPGGAPLQSADLVYFAAITDPSGAILWKQEFTTTLEFGKNRRAATLEELDPHIPLPKNATGAGYKVLLGFQLTPPEIEENRKQRNANSPAPASAPIPAPAPKPAPVPPVAPPAPPQPPVRKPAPVVRRPAPHPPSNQPSSNQPSSPQPPAAPTPYVPSIPYLDTPTTPPPAPAAPYSGLLQPGYVAPNRPAPSGVPSTDQ